MDEKNQNGITAYHGSPHEFEKFDTSKIGTGEGAQSYGHGLYFAENEPVAKAYRDKLGGEKRSPYYHDLVRKYYTPGNMIPSYGNNYDKVLDSKFDGDWLNSVKVQGVDKKGNPLPGFEGAQRTHASYPDIHELMRFFGRENVDKNKLYEPAGHMYEVAIDAHPDHFLDWDAGIDEQSQHVQNAINQLAALDEKTYGEGGGLGYYTSDPSSHAGSDVVKYLQGQHEGSKASSILHNAKIQGIKYFDQQSRDVGEGTRNYVVFDHNRVKVKRKYEQGGIVHRAEGGSVLDNAPTIEMPHSLQELQNWKKTHPIVPQPSSMDDIFTGRASGIEGQPPLAMPMNLAELQAYKRPVRATGGRIPDADKLFKEAKKELDGHTKPMLSVDDDAIVHALRIAQGRV